MSQETNKRDFPAGQGDANYPAVDMAPAAAADITVTHPSGDGVVDKTRIHAVAAGDTLAGLAAHYYGDAEAWPRIFAANRDQLTDPQRIAPGQMLKIPVDC